MKCIKRVFLRSLALKAEKMQQEEYRNLDKRRRNTIEQASVSVEGDGIKLE